MQVCANGVEREGFLEKVRLKLYLERNDGLTLLERKQKGIPGGGDCMKHL